MYSKAPDLLRSKAKKRFLSDKSVIFPVTFKFPCSQSIVSVKATKVICTSVQLLFLHDSFHKIFKYIFSERSIFQKNVNEHQTNFCYHSNCSFRFKRYIHTSKSAFHYRILGLVSKQHHRWPYEIWFMQVLHCHANKYIKMTKQNRT